MEVFEKMSRGKFITILVVSSSVLLVLTFFVLLSSQIGRGGTTSILDKPPPSENLVTVGEATQRTGVATRVGKDELEIRVEDGRTFTYRITEDTRLQSIQQVEQAAQPGATATPPPFTLNKQITIEEIVVGDTVRVSAEADVANFVLLFLD